MQDNAESVHDASGRGAVERRRTRGRWMAVVLGGAVIGLLAIVVVGAIDDAPHDGDAGVRTPAATDSGNDGIIERTITVVGQGSATAPPDAAQVRLGVEVTAGTANDAIDGANEGAAKILDLVEGAGVADTDVQTTDVSVYPQYGNDGRTITGYVASNRVMATVRDLDRIGGLLDAAAGIVGNDIRIEGITFFLDDTSKVDSEARVDAMADARSRAEEYATAAGIELGDVMSISETSSQVSPMPMYAYDEAAGASDSVPIATGETETSATVTVVFAIG